MNITKPDILHTYLRHKDINTYLDYLGYRYSSFVTVYTIGKTFEGRTLRAIKIDLYKNKRQQHSIKQPTDEEQQQQPKPSVSSSPKDKEPEQKRSGAGLPCLTGQTRPPSPVKPEPPAKPKVSYIDIRPPNPNIPKPSQPRHWFVIEAGTHAREWITVTTALYCIYQLTEKHCLNMELLQRCKFLIIPLVNADGYEYTHDKNRFWRKNRRPIPRCKSVGTDCNRNYDFHWETGNEKSSKSTYRGETPFSEPETCAVRNVLEKLGSNMKFFLSLHSYAQTIMYPWGYTRDLPGTWKQLHYLAEQGKNAIQKATGRKYRCGSISQLTKRTFSGSIVDYTFGVQKVPFALVMELPASNIGFQPSADHIKPLGRESWIGIKAMCLQTLEFLQGSCGRNESNLNLAI